MTKRIEVEPTAADFERVDHGVKNAQQNLRYLLAKRYARERVTRERYERRRARLRRLSLGLFGR
jgi:hypothetical protein